MFFEGIEAKVASGVKEEEVGYQLAFSKQELRKVLKEYPGKEVCATIHSLNLFTLNIVRLLDSSSRNTL